MTTAFVLSGGGNMGAVQVGMLAALCERDVVPDLLVGTSAGALNAAYLGNRGVTADAVDGLARLWCRVQRRDVFPLDPVRQMLALAGRRHSLCSSDPLRRLITDNVEYRQLQDATVPLHLLATSMLTGEQVCLTAGDVVPAVLASAAVPAVFPAVQLDGNVLCDGGLATTGGITRAVMLGADEVYLLPAGYACALTRVPARTLGAAMHALSLLIQRQLLLEVAHFAERVDLHVLPPLCPMSVPPLDFTRAGELIGRAYRETSTWLEERGDRLPRPERFLSLHDHDPDVPRHDHTRRQSHGHRADVPHRRRKPHRGEGGRDLARGGLRRPARGDR